MELSTRTREVLRYERWLKREGISCSLPKWVRDLLPKEIAFIDLTIPLPVFLRAVAMRGTLQEEEVLVGQVSFFEPKTARPVILHLHQVEEAKRLADFGKALFMTEPASILRTAIMIGLSLPRIKLGVISPTRLKPFTLRELKIFWAEGNDVLATKQGLLDDGKRIDKFRQPQSRA